MGITILSSPLKPIVADWIQADHSQMFSLHWENEGIVSTALQLPTEYIWFNIHCPAISALR